MRSNVIGTLEHIHEAAGYIEVDAAGLTFDAFIADRRFRQVVERNLVIIGEALDRLGRHAPEFAKQIIANNRIAVLRDALLYEYDRVDYAALWVAVLEALPQLRTEVGGLLRESDGA